MTDIISVRFKSGGKHYYFDPAGLTAQVGQGVIVETSRGLEYGECVEANRQVPDEQLNHPLRPAIRLATEEDEQTVARNHEKQERAFAICQQKISEHGLEMKLVDAEYSFEGNKVIFFFTAEGRVDFRALVKDLAAAIHARIELRQIGVRDEAKILGGLGICGRPLCCAQFLDEFQPVSIKMAKTQNLSLNPTKISGTCGRLMCCLKYEQDAYEDLVHRCPKMESFVETPDGAGTVCSVNLLREKSNVRLEADPETPRTYHNCELCVIRNGKGKRPEDYVPKSPAELEKLRMTPVVEPEPETLTSNPLAAALEAVFSGNAPTMEGQEGESRDEQSRHRRRQRRPRTRHEGEGDGKRNQPQKSAQPPAEKKEQQSRPPKKPRNPQPQGGQPAPQDAAPSGEQKKRPPRRRRRPGGGKGNGENRPTPAGE